LTNLTNLRIDRNDLTGAVPEELTNLTLLSTFRLYTNMLTDLPDVSGLDSLTDLRIQDNRFTFEDIEPNIGIPGFIYSPQDSVGEEQSTTLSEGESITFSVDVGGAANQYQWMKNEADITGAQSADLHFTSVSLSDDGTYICKITNTIAPALTLYSRPAVLTVQSTDVADDAGTIPERFGLYQNYPNPFNPVTSIAYDLPETSRVLLDVYDLQGRRVVRLEDGIKKAGRHSVKWSADDDSGRPVPSGIYICRIQAGEFQQSRKVVLSK
jgi:Leucine-rich repeat (LRR) protein